MTFEIIPRQGLVVWLYTTKHARNLRKYGYVYYVSRKMRYAILYVDRAIVDETVQALQGLKFVKEVELSHRDEIDMTFADAIPDRLDPDAQDPEDSEDDSEDFFQQIAQELQGKKAGDE